MIPKYNEMYREVLEVVNRHKELKLIALIEEVSNLLNLSEEDRNETLDNDKRIVV